MAVGYSPRNSSGKPAGTTTPFHHPPRPLPERSRTAPMAVPNAHHAPPPPLPPPRLVDSGNHDLGWHMGNAGRTGSLGGSLGQSASVRPGSSLLGGGQHPRPGKTFPGQERSIDFARKENPRSAPAQSLLATLKAQDAQPRAQQQQHQQHQNQNQPHTSHNQQQRPRSESNSRLPDLRFLDYSTYKLQSEKQMSKEALERSSHAYDKQLLSRIGGQNQGPGGSSEGSPTSPGASVNSLSRLNGQLMSLSMLKNRDGSTPPSSMSPGFSGLKSPLSDSGLDHAPPLPSFPRQQHNLPHHHLHRTSSGTSVSRRESSENPFALFGAPTNRLEFRDLSASALANLRLSTPAMQGLNVQERRSSPSGSDDHQASKTGQKRRAQSPPSDSVIDPRLPAGAGAGADSWQRSANSPLQLSGNRGPQAARFHPSQTQGSSSLSTTASSAPRNSYASSFGLSNPSTAATSYTSDRISPSLYPSAADSRPQTVMSAYQPAQNSPLIGGGAQPMAQPQHPPQQAPPPLGTPTYIHRKNNSGILRAPGLWICDCCPKKPKKFESEEELRIHEMEKQYICQYCHNRFKNKNEAERHQNSLHLRRHSWSCSALTTIEAAFHPTPVNNLSVQFNRLSKDGAADDPTSSSYQALHQTATDTCGYCGQEFINPPNWDERVEHLNHVHKFGECNQSKKFFRADHFRQHLKHSHAGTSGKWTNMLENACMKDEPLPQPIAPGIMPGVPNAMPGGVPGIAMVGQQALLAQHQLQQQQAQAAQQQHDQQQQHVAAPQATMASILSSALGQHTSTHSQQEQSHYGNGQSAYGGEQSNPYSQAQAQAQQAQQQYQHGQKSETSP